MMNRTLSSRAAQAQDSSYRNFMRSLGSVGRYSRRALSPRDAGRFGLMYKKGE